MPCLAISIGGVCTSLISSKIDQGELSMQLLALVRTQDNLKDSV
jgi:hypothetical protein